MNKIVTMSMRILRFIPRILLASFILHPIIFLYFLVSVSKYLAKKEKFVMKCALYLDGLLWPEDSKEIGSEAK